MASQRSKLFLIRPQVLPAGKSKHSRNAKQIPQEQKREQPSKIALEQAFNYLQSFEGYEIGELDAERAILAIAFLLCWGADGGNESLDGGAAYGLGVLLQQAASRAARHRDDEVQS